MGMIVFFPGGGKSHVVVGLKPPPNRRQNHPRPLWFGHFRPLGWFYATWGGFIPPFSGGIYSPKRLFLPPHLAIGGEAITPLW